jgi:hypothetical protein
MDKEMLTKLLASVNDGVQLSMLEQLKVMMQSLKSARNGVGRELTTDELIEMLSMMIDSAIDIFKQRLAE